MISLRVDALLAGGICLPNGPLALDALLTYAMAQRDGLDPPRSAEECRDLPIPLAELDGIWMASFSAYEVETREAEYTNRRFPLSEAQDMGERRLKRVQLTAGPSKSYRLPRERMHMRDDRMTWWALGDIEAVRNLLLEWVPYLGKRRGVGLGRVREWAVTPCEPWEGFPVLRGGAPTRPLPLSWPGVDWTIADRAVCALRPPYWAHHRREECAVPVTT